MADFEEGCPYFRLNSLDRSAPICRPMFRLEEKFSDRSTYTGDSFGDHSYIDTSITRLYSFAFEVRKTVYGINVKLNSFVLYEYLPFLLVHGRERRSKKSDVIDGFHLLESIDTLESRLRELRAEMQGSLPSNSFFRTLIPSREECAQFEAELSLLVEGLVADDQVFESFGYENLYEKGFLTYDRWKSFQSSKTSRSLDQLDWATHRIDQFEEDEDFNEMGSDGHPEPLPAIHPGPSVPSLGITPPQYEIGEPGNDRNSPLIAAIYMGRNDVIARLLALGANPMILSHIKQEDQWLVAQSLLDHGVNATLLFESTHDFGHVEPRLLCILMERGLDIYSSWPTPTQGFLAHGLQVSDHEIQQAKSMRAHNYQLLGAIQRGNLRSAEEQISHGADPTLAIDSALAGGKWKMLRFLLHKGADPRVLEFGKPMVYLQEDVITDACLLTVAEKGLTAVVKSLLHLRGSNKMVAEDLCRPSLTKLIRLNRTPILRMLLYKGIFSRAYLASSSEWSLPKAAKISMPLFRLLLRFGACASTALIAAVTNRDLNSVSFLLKGMKECPMQKDINLLQAPGSMTLLMKAVHDGSVEIAQHLIDNGADPYMYSMWGNSFDIAERKGFKGLSRMLHRVVTPQLVRRSRMLTTCEWGDIRKWGAYEIRFDFSELRWQAEVMRSSGRSVVKGLPNRNTAITLRQGSRRPNKPTISEDCLKTIKIRCLHREFRRQHTYIVKCARASTYLGWSRPREEPHCSAWGDFFYCNLSKAWSRAVAVMRGLCRGEAPSTLYDTIMFLAIGKAICLSKIGSGLSDRHAEFLADLGRWQVLFRSDEWSLSAFRNAVSDIWQVSAEELDRHHPLDSTSLIQFQELAMSLVKDVEQSFDHRIDRGNGLLASQERWSSNRAPEMFETQRAKPFIMQFPENTVERGKFTESDPSGSTTSGETDVSQTPETQTPLRDAIKNDSRHRTCNMMVVLLMAGFVFSVVLIFLKELQDGPLLPNSSASTAPDSYSSVLLRGILQGAVHHLCLIIKNEFALNVVQKVETTLSNAVQQGYIEDFSDLTSFVKEGNLAHTSGEPSVAIRIRLSLLAACSIWQPSYDLQQRYHTLQTYLGLKDYESIVPHAIHPTTPAEEPNFREGFSRLNSQGPSNMFPSPHSQLPEYSTSAPAVAYANDTEIEMQIPSSHDSSQISHGDPQPMLDSSPPPHQQRSVSHTGDLPDRPRAKTYCKECKHDFKTISNYNKHRKDKHEKVRFACRHPPCRMKYSRKNYRDIHEEEKHVRGPA